MSELSDMVFLRTNTIQVICFEHTCIPSGYNPYYPRDIISSLRNYE
jgi:hypothetical protein